MSNTTFRRGKEGSPCSNGHCCYQAVCFRKHPIVEGDGKIHAAQCLKQEAEDLGRALDNYIQNGMPKGEVKA